MTIIHAQIDLDALGYTLADWVASNLAKHSKWHEVVVKPEWDNHQRNLLEGWINAGNAEDFSMAGIFDNDTIAQPGIYALVYDPDKVSKNPILDPRTFLFGEGTQPVYKRIYSNTAALRGRTTNTSSKWEAHLGHVCYTLGISRLKPVDVTVFYRPHRVSDPDFQYERTHSQAMETQAHAMFWALHNKKTAGNTRDLPYDFHLDKAKALLESLGYKCKYQ